MCVWSCGQTEAEEEEEDEDEDEEENEKEEMVMEMMEMHTLMRSVLAESSKLQVPTVIAPAPTRHTLTNPGAGLR